MFIEPMLAVDAELEQREGFSYQVKWDGVRCVAHCLNGQVRLYSRNGGDISTAFPEVVNALKENFEWGMYKDLFLDGEIVCLEQGRPRFDRTLQRCSVTSPTKGELLSLRYPSKFIIFDSFTPQDTLTYIDRYVRMQAAVNFDQTLVMSVSYSDLEELRSKVTVAALEGIVGRSWDGLYHPGERAEIYRWKQISTIDAMIFGYEKGTGVREGGFGAFLLAVPEGFGWRFVGKVSSGISDQELSDILSDLNIVQTFPNILGYEETREAVYVEPGRIIEVSHLGYEQTGMLRNPSFVRRRKDKEFSTI